jgi:multiple sugar transport system substrate-binding protein
VCAHHEFKEEFMHGENRVTRKTAMRRPVAYTAAAAAAAISLLALTGCSTASAGANSEGTSTAPLEVMSNFTPSDAMGSTFAKDLADFTKKTGIKVHAVTVGPDELQSAYEASVLAKKEPDVVITNLYDKSLQWINNGAALPVTQYVDSWGLKKDIEPAALADWTDSKNRVQAFPLTGFTWPVWYNTAVLKSAGIDSVPTTTTDLIAAAKKLRAAGKIPMAVGGSDWSGEKIFFQILETGMSDSAAKKVMSEGGYCASKPAMSAIKNFVALRDAGLFPDNVQGLTSQNEDASFQQGNAAIMSDGSWSFPSMPASMTADITLGGFPLPAGSPHAKPIAFQAFTDNGIWLTPNGAKRLQDFETFTKFMLTANVGKGILTAGGALPTVPVADAASVLSAQSPLLSAAVTTLPKTVDYGPFPDASVPGPKTQPITSAISQAFTNGTSAGAICASLDGAYK